MASDIDGWGWLSIQMGDKSDNQPEGGRRLEDQNASDAHVRESAGESKSRSDRAKKGESALHQKDGIMGSGASSRGVSASGSRAARARPAQGAAAIDAVSSSLRTAYQSMINESVPDEMMDLLKKLG